MMKRVIALISIVVSCVLLTPVAAQQPPTLIYGQSSGIVKPVAVDSSGGIVLGAGSAAVGTVALGAGTAQTGFLSQRITYTAATTAKTATAAGTGPFFSICGSATTTLRIQQLTIGGTVATAAVYGDITLRKTSATTTSGTITTLTKVPMDSADAASSANLVNFYTVLATGGALVGTVGAQSAVFPITATVAAQLGQVVFDWTNRQESKAPILRGTAQCLEAGFGTTTTNVPTLMVEVKWTEE